MVSDKSPFEALNWHITRALDHLKSGDTESAFSHIWSAGYITSLLERKYA